MATLVRWEPFREVAALQNELGRFMNSLMEGDGGAQRWVPAVDIWETENEIVYAFDLPGIDQEKISVEVENDALTLSAERERTQQESRDTFFRFERRYGTFARTVGLPQGVSEESIDASYTDGVLEIRVPKPAEQKPRRIQIANGGKATIEGESTQK
jgi:HSP20 family protein